jgi:hypothetical protein
MIVFRTHGLVSLKLATIQHGFQCGCRDLRLPDEPVELVRRVTFVEFYAWKQWLESGGSRFTWLDTTIGHITAACGCDGTIGYALGSPVSHKCHWRYLGIMMSIDNMYDSAYVTLRVTAWPIRTASCHVCMHADGTHARTRQNAASLTTSMHYHHHATMHSSTTHSPTCLQ